MIDLQQLITQNRHLSEEVKRRVDQLAAINTVAASVSQSLDLNLTLQTALQAVLNITEAKAGGISLIDEEAGEIVLRAQQGWVRDFVKENPMRIPLGKQGMSWRVIASDNVIVNNDLNENEPLAVPQFHDEHFRSIAMAPMHARSKIIGILSIMSYKPNSFDESIVEVLSAIADTVGVALDNARLYEASIENQHRLSAVLHSTADGIITTDQNGRIRLVNYTAENLLEVGAHQLIGTPLRAAAIPQRIRDSLLFALSSRSEERNKAFRVDTESGRVLSVLVSPVYVESQAQPTAVTDRWVIVLQDVTHLREAEIARTQFIQAAAHDMRNPLGAALNSLTMLRRRINTPDAEVGEIIGIAETGISRIQDLLDDLLNLEQIQSGYGLNLEEVDIGELVYEVSAAIRPLVQEKSIDYRVDLKPGIPPLNVDRRWLTRAISNYLDNAIKYTTPGSQITLSLFINEPMLHIEVADNGPGIPVEQQARLFERFYRANAHSGIPGTGLGLAIVKSVAEAHGGGVYLQSSPDQGSVFGMTLLLARVEA
jgi:PAS domain S-box-containing protein